MANDYLKVGAVAPDLTLPGTGGVTVQLAEQRGRWVVLFFYPKDMTAGCTREACGFAERHDRLVAAGAVVFGLSPDPVGQHERFVAKHELPFVLLADEDKRVSKAYGTWRLRTRGEQEYHGVARTTYVIDPAGVVATVFADVDPRDHAAEVLTWLESHC